MWPGDPPGDEGVTATEEIIERSKDPAVRDRAVLHVRKPTLKVFRPAKPDGSAVLVLPGGGYQRVVLDKEGDETAMRLARAGVTAAVLVYRLPEDGWEAGRDAPLQDAQRAMRLLRSDRVATSLDAKRIGVLGFSAGGHLAAALALDGARRTYGDVDAADVTSARPDFAALIYAAYLGGAGSPALLRGTGAARDLIAAVDRDTQPIFLLHAADDTTVPVESSVRMYQALKAAGVPAELHVFPEGGHGFGIARAAGKPVEVWPDLFLRWGRARGMFR
ncbi:MAG: alpha/beta hydrolase [Hyphomonadaceae bacterium]|nr:alpha/beta hydrolase [Hyphomonadaceae bacterium]